MANGENCPGCADKAAPISGGHEPWHRHLADGPAAPISGSGNRMVAFKPLGERGPTVYRDMTGIPPEAVQRLQDVAGVSVLLERLGGASTPLTEGRSDSVLLGETPGVNLTPVPTSLGSLRDPFGDWGPEREEPPREADRPKPGGYRWTSPYRELDEQIRKDIERRRIVVDLYPDDIERLRAARDACEDAAWRSFEECRREAVLKALRDGVIGAAIAGALVQMGSRMLIRSLLAAMGAGAVVLLGSLGDRLLDCCNALLKELAHCEEKYEEGIRELIRKARLDE